MQYPEPIAKLIDSYMKLPGIGQKTATRLAFYTIDMKDEVVNEFAKSLLSVKRDLHFCSICGNITEEDPCEICRNPSRDRSVILVVEEPKDVMAMEKMREYHGATAMYLSRLIKPAGIKVTRLAHGLSVGSDIEYADEVTLLKAVEGRREL